MGMVGGDVCWEPWKGAAELREVYSDVVKLRELLRRKERRRAGPTNKFRVIAGRRPRKPALQLKGPQHAAEKDATRMQVSSAALDLSSSDPLMHSPVEADLQDETLSLCPPMLVAALLCGCLELVPLVTEYRWSDLDQGQQAVSVTLKVMSRLF